MIDFLQELEGVSNLDKNFSDFCCRPHSFMNVKMNRCFKQLRVEKEKNSIQCPSFQVKREGTKIRWNSIDEIRNNQWRIKNKKIEYDRKG